jgi:hypothetical protein
MRKVIKSLVKEFHRRREENKLLQDYITKRIIDGQEHRRNELVEKQAEEKEIELFLEFLNKAK